MDVVAAFTETSRAVANATNLIEKSAERHNTPEMLMAAAMEEIGKSVDQYREHIKNKNLAAFRTDAAPPAAGG